MQNSSINVNQIVKKLLDQPGMKEYFNDCVEIKMSEEQVMVKLFDLIGASKKTVRELNEIKPGVTEEDITKAIGVLIDKLRVDVNSPCYIGNQDLMYNALKYGSKEEVEMLFEKGYNFSNCVDGMKVSGYLMPNFPDYEEKEKIIKKYDREVTYSDKDGFNLTKFNNIIKRRSANQKTLNAKELFETNQVACILLKEYGVVNAEKAFAKIIPEMVALGASMDELKSVVQYGEIYDLLSGKNFDIYYKLLDAHNIKVPKSQESSAENEN